MDEVATGLCQCGCGQPTPIAARTRVHRGQIKGQPLPFLRNHTRVNAEADRFWSKVDKSGECWLWLGARDLGGYGRFMTRPPRKRVSTHRWAYQQVIGPIPDGLVLDHLCCRRECVNPAHLEPVTNRENLERGSRPALPLSCPQGHRYDAANTYWYGNARKCRACHQAANARYMATRRVS